ncbi:MAG: DNA topoisomerase, partial [Candidatus Staskawiczbacteria bacterium]
MEKQKNNSEVIEKIISLCKRRGFIFPGSEVYGGLANSWDYGPLGVELKNNIKNLWWKRFVHLRDDMVGIDAALIMNPKVWENSGHVATFSDPLVECKKCHHRFREDQLEDKNKCPDCKGELLPAKQFNLISDLMRREDVDLIYSCTDSGREGEYIFRLVYMQSECTKPAKRVWISSHTEESIKKGIEEAKDIKEYNSLSTSAFCRAKEDWLFGMNFSRMYTCLFGKKLSAQLNQEKSSVIAIGRVMTCVLGLIVDRELEMIKLKKRNNSF